jgi:hypothetical protein
VVLVAGRRLLTGRGFSGWRIGCRRLLR